MLYSNTIYVQINSTCLPNLVVIITIVKIILAILHMFFRALNSLHTLNAIAYQVVINNSNNNRLLAYIPMGYDILW